MRRSAMQLLALGMMGAFSGLPMNSSAFNKMETRVAAIGWTGFYTGSGRPKRVNKLRLSHNAKLKRRKAK